MHEFCTFDARGHEIHSCHFMHVDKVNDVLTLEFFNNMVIPFKVIASGADVVKFLFCGTEVFRLGGSRGCYVMCEIEYIMLNGTVSFRLYTGNSGVSWNFVCDVAIGPFYGITLGSVGYKYEAIQKWMADCEVTEPIGCGLTEHGSVGRDCSIEKCGNCIIATFPNGYKFPIVMSDWFIQVVKKSVKRLNSDVYMVYFTVHEYWPEYVKFDVSLYAFNNLTVIHDVEMINGEATLEDEWLSRREITKLMVLGA